MLIQFSAENFLSIKNKCILSLEPSCDKEHLDNLVVEKNNSALKTIAIYGANASGKSNIFKALTFSILMIRNSNSTQYGMPLPITPFKFDDVSVQKPSSFEYVFIANDKQKYIYGFSATREKIYEEYLYCYKTAKPSLIFDRKNCSEYEFTQALKAKLQPLADRNIDNKLFLATATSWNAEATKPAFEWFARQIETFTSNEGFEGIALEMYSKDENHELLAFTENLLKQADINIDSISFKAREVKNNGMLHPEVQLLVNGMPAPSVHMQYEIQTKHIINNEEESRQFNLSLQEESEGTQRLFFYAPLISSVIKNGSTLVIDEIDKSMHPFIVKHLFGIFNNPEINKSGAQLIATTHDTSLLSLDFFRRDQIYFVEKDNDTGTTDLYSLDDFSVRKEENIEKGYLLGRYGAIPYIHAEDLIG